MDDYNNKIILLAAGIMLILVTVSILVIIAIGLPQKTLNQMSK